nr:MAG TPA: hypothetical protein [Microviridae sp.]
MKEYKFSRSFLFFINKRGVINLWTLVFYDFNSCK